jgi:hypothetical protein
MYNMKILLGDFNKEVAREIRIYSKAFWRWCLAELVSPNPAPEDENWSLFSKAVFFRIPESRMDRQDILKPTIWNERSYKINKNSAISIENLEYPIF